MANAENRAKIDWLNRYRQLDKEIDCKCEELSKWRSRAERVTTSLSLAPGASNEGDRVSSAVEKIIALEGEINASIDELLQVRKAVEHAIQGVPDSTLRILLALRYIDGMTWEQVAVTMHYTYQWVCVLHGRALKQLIVIDTPPVV